jgi:hypothetical protein
MFCRTAAFSREVVYSATHAASSGCPKPSSALIYNKWGCEGVRETQLRPTVAAHGPAASSGKNTGHRSSHEALVAAWAGIHILRDSHYRR